MKEPKTWLFIFIVCLLSLFLCKANSYGQTPVVHISGKPSWISSYKPYDQKPPLRTIQDGYFFAVVDYQIHLEKQASYRHYIREIVSASGIQDGSQISASFDPAFERLDFHQILSGETISPKTG